MLSCPTSRCCSRFVVSTAPASYRETIRLLNTGKQVVVTAGWTLYDGRQVIASLMASRCNNPGAVSLHSKVVNRQSIDLYLGVTGAVWMLGRMMTLRDGSGVIQLIFTFCSASRRRRGIALGLLALALLAGGCSGRRAAEPYHRTQPSELYLYTLLNYELYSPFNCSWHCTAMGRTHSTVSISGDRMLTRRFRAVRCPELPYTDGLDRHGAAQALLGQALQTAYFEVSLPDTFVVGFGEAGTVALQNAVSSRRRWPGWPPSPAGSSRPLRLVPPFGPILAASGDRAASDCGQAFVGTGRSPGFRRSGW